MADFKTFDGYKLKDVQGRETLSEIEAYIGYPDDNVLGLSADFENNDFVRLGMAKNLNPGSDFNTFKMYGDRKLCNLADDGTITAWYGDPNYTETGYTTIVDPDTQEESTIQVQVMVRQPKFYYKVVPIKLEPITTTSSSQTNVHGYSGVKMNYYISDKPLPGFKLHPAFINANGDEVDCYYIGAYEACLFDVSENRYLKYDSWDVTYDEQAETYTINSLNAYLADKDYDKLSSISDIKPASGGNSSQFLRINTNAMANNRGSRWSNLNVKIVSAEQLLMIIEYASFNTQTAIGRGIRSFSSGSDNESAFTGSTTMLGNGSGSATETISLRSDGTLYKHYTQNALSVRYRGVENHWGNVWVFVSGINIWGNGTMAAGEAYVCNDFEYSEEKNNGNYKPVGFTMYYDIGNSYILYFGYSREYDWIFLPTKKGGTSSLPIGDSLYSMNSIGSYRIYELGGGWAGEAKNGGFYYYFRDLYTNASPSRGARLCYV